MSVNSSYSTAYVCILATNLAKPFVYSVSTTPGEIAENHFTVAIQGVEEKERENG